MKKPVIVIGAGGHAKILIDILMLSSEYYLEAVIGREDETAETILGHQILKGDTYLEEYLAKGINHAAIGIGAYTDNHRRKEIFDRIKGIGFFIVNLIHPSAIISDSVIMGDGAVIFAGVVANPDVIIGSNVIIATGSTIDHETIIEDHVLVSAGVTVGAGDLIGEGSLLALGSNIISRVSIGKYSLVAAGAVVTCDIPDRTTVYGIPAKPRSKPESSSHGKL
ncbi:MAG: acetyltransferase [Candidatus Cloacimonetes bacterium]|nr:acetyltransferase [Candidatus Cloacimonadota bacterium]